MRMIATDNPRPSAAVSPTLAESRLLQTSLTHDGFPSETVVLASFPDFNLSVMGDSLVGLAIAAAPCSIRKVIEPQTIGTYFLLAELHPIYVGRSDSCLMRRLATHNYLDRATHVVWESCRHPVQAFYLEAAWYHMLMRSPGLLNSIHPARPPGFTVECPFCGDAEQESRALMFAIGRVI